MDTMIAWINGVMVQGSPEEIERYRQIATADGKYKICKLVRDDVPEHVKEYGKYNRTYKSTSANKMRSWF